MNTDRDPVDVHVAEYFERLIVCIRKVPIAQVQTLGEILFRAYMNDKQVFVIGNGGSAATASHMAADIAKNTLSPNMRRFRILSLTDNTPLLTALGNDLGYDRVFSEQLVNLIRPGDVLVSISGSGRSPNVLEAMSCARDRAATNVALLGFDGGEALMLADEHVLVPSDDYGVIEDIHMILVHALTAHFKRQLHLARVASR
jgi:D-sedoheptulose 7-phosphate isomerase